MRSVPRTALIGAVAMAGTLATALPARAGITATSEASVLKDAITSSSSLATGASFVTLAVGDPEFPGTPHGTGDSPLASFPRNGSTFAIMTSGDALLADDANSGNASVSNGGGNVRGNSDLDVSILRIDVEVPIPANCLSIDFRFLSDEFPEYLGGSVNDAFIAELDTSDWTTTNSSIVAENNFAFDPNGDVVSVNSPWFDQVPAENQDAAGNPEPAVAEAAGTTYDGATPVLRASTPVTPGEHSLYLSIFDQGDHSVDSAVFLDNLVAGTSTEAGCTTGATPPPPADPCEEPTAEGTAGGNKMAGTDGSDRFRGMGGRDFLDGGEGDDQLCGGDGGDYVYGRGGIDASLGDGGNDRVFGGRGDDDVSGGSGHDALFAGKGNDRIAAQDGAMDCIRTGQGDDEVTADSFDRIDPARGCPPGFWL